MSKGLITTIGIIAAGIAFVLLHPVIHRDPGVSRDKYEMQSLAMAMKQYQAEYGHFPTGESKAIIAALSGDNPRKMVFLDWTETSRHRASMDADPWGTPYRIMTVSNDVVITCAGPDQIYDTNDDQSAK